MLDQDKAFALKGKLVGDSAAIVNRHLVLLIFPLALFVGFRRADAAVARRLFAGVDE